MGTLIQDLRYGIRMLAKNPGFTVVAVLTLALGIGANTAIFSVVNAVVLRHLPYPSSDRLVWISEVIPAFKAEVAGGADYVDWKEQNRTLDQVTAYDPSAGFDLTGRGTPARVHAARVGASFFSTFRVDPQLGRSFTGEEDQPNGRKAVILMHAFWQQYFGSDPHLLGQAVILDGAPYTLVGVMPATFKFPGGPEVQMLVPLGLNEASERLRVRQTLVHIVGRLKPGVTVKRAGNDLDAILKRAQAATLARAGSGGAGRGPATEPPPGPGQNLMMRFDTRNASPAGPVRGAPPAGVGSSRAGAGGDNQSAPVTDRRSSGGGPARALKPAAPPETELRVVGLGEHLAGNLRPAMLTMLGVVGLVLLIACANVANLMLARASARTREVAVRAALGAGRGRLVRQLLTESVVLGLGGGIAGLLLAAWSVDVMTRLIPSSVGSGILSLERPHVDARVLLFALAVSVTTGILFGLAPAFAATSVDLVERLKDSGQGASAGAGRGLLRGALAVAELSLALVVLIGAGLLIKSFYRVLSVDLGFAPEHVETMNLSLNGSRYAKPEQKLAFFSEVLRRVESLPGVRSAALGDSLPLSPYRGRLMIRRELVTQPGSTPGSGTVQMSRLTVSSAYFDTLGIPLLRGRTFTDHDDEHSAKVAVVNEALARRFWPGEDPIGKPIPMLGDAISVVGVVGNTHHDGPGEDVQSEIYVPYLQAPGNSMQLALRTAMDPSGLVSAVRHEVAALDPEEPISKATTLEQTLSETIAPRRFNTVLLGIFAAIALAVSTVGIYGVIAYTVTQRIREVGIRMALGAQRSDVLKLMVGRGFKLTLMGVGIGVIGALALTRFLASWLYGVKPTDPLTFIVVSLLLTFVALLASYIPARRATKVDPMVALRYE